MELLFSCWHFTLSSKLTRCILSPCTVTNYTLGRNWGAKSANGYIKINPSPGYGLSSTEVDLIIQEVASTKISGRAVNLELKGANAAKTSASDKARASIIADGGTVLTN